MSGIIDYKSYAGSAKLPDEQYGIYKNIALQDPSIFDFYNNLLDGPNKREWSNHNAWNASIEQTFLNNRLGFNFVADKQDYKRGQVNLMQDYGQAITLDMNTNLADGSINENFGRACVVSDSQSNSFYTSNRESYRLTGFGELRAEDFLGKTRLASVLGRHVFMGMMSQETAKFENQGWFRWAADPSYGDVIGTKLMTNRSVNTLTYLSPRISNRASISGAFIGRLEAVQAPVSGTLRHFDGRWAGTADPGAVWADQYGNPSNQSENPANYKGWTNRPLTVLDSDKNDRADLVTSASLTKYKIDSKAANWQAYLFDGVFVSTVGIRTDRQKSWSLNANGNDKTQDPVYKNMLINSPDYRLPEEPNSVVAGRSSSWSYVLHTPKSIRARMWGNTGLSLTFNRSSNFQPAAGRVDAVGNKLAPPNGTTKDVGLVLETLDDRLVLKINWYETKVKNDALQDFGGTYMLPAVESWGYYFAKNNLMRTGNFSGSNKGLGGYSPKNTLETVQDAQARGDAICNAWMANLPNDAWFNLWGIDRSLWTSWMGWSNPSGFTITGDTKSKGVEYEATFNPTKTWSITMNAAKTSAQRLSMAGSLVDWVEARWKTFNTPVLVGGKQVGVIGDVQFWGADYNAGETAGGKFGREFMAPYRLYRLQENSDVPELRPWRFNLVTNYNFNTGLLKGANVGGGYRWQDKIVTGYKLMADPAHPTEKTFDLDNPYMGRAETNIDLWAGYSHKLTAKVGWRVQLNLRNVTTSKSLIPVTVQPDGTMAVGRIADPYSWTLTNTFTF